MEQLGLWATTTAAPTQRQKIKINILLNSEIMPYLITSP